MRCSTSREPCDHCPCHRDDAMDPALQVFNFAKDAAWKRALFTAARWKEISPNRHILFRGPWTFLSSWNCEPDILHIMCLGLYQTIIGSTLWVLVYQCLSGSPVNNTQQVWNHILEYYKAHKVPCQFASIGLTTFHNPAKPRNKYPRLKGKAWRRSTC